MEPGSDASVRRTQSDLGGQALITAALLGSNWNQTTLLPTLPMPNTSNAETPATATAAPADPHKLATRNRYQGKLVTSAAEHGNLIDVHPRNRVRKLTRHYAKAHLRRSASQPVVLHSGDTASTSSTSSTVLLNSEDDDADAGLCLSEDDSSEDTDALCQQQTSSPETVSFIDQPQSLPSSGQTRNYINANTNYNNSSNNSNNRKERGADSAPSSRGGWPSHCGTTWGSRPKNCT